MQAWDHINVPLLNFNQMMEQTHNLNIYKTHKNIFPFQTSFLFY